jgi:hypothetical protein
MWMRKAVKYELSARGRVCTIYFEDGSTAKVEFENFLKTFNNYKRAVIEYCTYVWVLANNSQVGDAAAKEIKEKLLSN